MTALRTKDDIIEQINVWNNNASSEHGTMIVCGDYEGDVEAIAKVLNAFEFGQGDMSDQPFLVRDGRIQPALFNNGLSATWLTRRWYTSKDGRRLPANEFPELPAEEEWERDCDVPENLSLNQLSKTIAPLLTRGTLELVSVWAYRIYDLQFARLAIRSDGRAQAESRIFTSAPVKNWRQRYRETFQPREEWLKTFRESASHQNSEA
jgi:hypothetical protein